ncbi:hypothetical protein NP233_g6392 [Leucocoprinus birnbaumii]|uniref:Uncharacterized protein n=1 Tax=Leucocoprinus birnbaumii TaxID=56174 RepID=A0AAD5VSB4_9AGAR|nr:hypothetical protein NP233_g6392 [Leucocoprinus birnbaumii]
MMTVLSPSVLSYISDKWTFFGQCFRSFNNHRGSPKSSLFRALKHEVNACSAAALLRFTLETSVYMLFQKVSIAQLLHSRNPAKVMSELANIPPGCIPAQPDIAGIGVRVSVYAQNSLVIMFAFFTLFQFSFREKRAHITLSQANIITLTACALLFAAIVQAKTLGMSTYHGLIVLNLAWVNGLSTFTCFCFFRWMAIPRTVQSSPGRAALLNRIFHGTPDERRIGRQIITPLIACSVHCTVLGVFGLWYWATLNNFGTHGQCESKIPISLPILGHAVSINSPTVRRASLIIYGALVFPLFNLATMILIAAASALCLIPVSILVLLFFIAFPKFWTRALEESLEGTRVLG